MANILRRLFSEFDPRPGSESTHSDSVTIPVDTNIGAIVTIYAQTTGDVSPTAKIGGEDMTLVGSNQYSGGLHWVYMFKKENPTTGSTALELSWNSFGGNLYYHLAVYSGVDQSNMIDDSEGASANDASIAVTLTTSDPKDWVVVINRNYDHAVIGGSNNTPLGASSSIAYGDSNGSVGYPFVSASALATIPPGSARQHFFAATLKAIPDPTTTTSTTSTITTSSTTTTSTTTSTTSTLSTSTSSTISTSSSTSISISTTSSTTSSTSTSITFTTSTTTTSSSTTTTDPTTSTTTTLSTSTSTSITLTSTTSISTSTTKTTSTTVSTSITSSSSSSSSTTVSVTVTGLPGYLSRSKSSEFIGTTIDKTSDSKSSEFIINTRDH